MLKSESIASFLLNQRLALTAYLATVTRNHHLAEDVFQDICVKAISHQQGFESHAHLLNWARLTGRNRAIDLLRTRDGKYEGLGSEVLDALSEVWPEQHSGHVNEQQEHLKACLQTLTSNNQEILRLRYLEGRSGADVAGILGRKLESVYQALARIHKSLRQCVRQKMAMVEG